MSEAHLSVEAQLALLHRDVKEVKELVTGVTQDHESRIRKLEQFKWLVLGAATASAGGAGAVVAQLLGN
jgi:hypothetical protein